MNGDRYRLRDLADFRDQFEVPSIDQQRLGSLIQEAEFTYTSSKWSHHPQLKAVPLQIHLANSTTSNVGRIVLDIGVELRRTASYLERGSIRPPRNNESVELISAQQESSIDLVVASAKEIYRLLTSRPIDFMMLLDWLWAHRQNRLKVRSRYEQDDPRRRWSDIVDMATICAEKSHPVAVTMRVDSDGSTNFGFTSA
jgi:hypothetical protein